MSNIYNTNVKKISSHNPLLWGVSAVLFGVLLITWQGELLNKLVLVLGIIFLVVSIVQFINFMRVTKGIENRWTLLPFGTVVAFILGIVLIAMPETWVSIMMILVGLLIFLLGLSSLTNLYAMRKIAPIKWWYFIFPVMQMISGALVVSEPMFLADFIIIFAGVWIIMYGIFEFLGYFMLEIRK